jgi:hypothetical protein
VDELGRGFADDDRLLLQVMLVLVLLQASASASTSVSRVGIGDVLLSAEDTGEVVVALKALV